jgi:DNA-binding LacI/PurR family transcriptional regulator
VAQRKSGHVTLADVARASGFAVSTVSMVLSEAPFSQHVAASSREHIRAVARQLGYHPDAYARSLRRRRSQTVGVLAFDLSDPFCIPVVRGIQTCLQAANYLPLLMDAQAERGLFDRYLQLVLESRSEGLIVIASWIFEEANLLADLKKNHVPIVIVARDWTARGISSVLVDNEAGGALAMRHLFELGHRQIAVIRGPEELFDSAPRWAGAQQFAAKAGIRLDPQLVFQLPGNLGPTSSFEGGLKLSRQMLDSKRSFTAVLAFDDLTALGVVRGLNGAGLRVPEDYSVLGFDDVLQASVATPGITTIRQPLKEMGLLAAEWVLKEVTAQEQKSEPITQLYKAQPELVVRMSSSRPIHKSSSAVQKPVARKTSKSTRLNKRT